jgi:hypothetical protein
MKGQTALFLKDANIRTSDGREADEVNVEILRIELERAVAASHEQGDGTGDGDNQAGAGEDDGVDVTIFNEPAGSGISVNLLALTIPVLLTRASLRTGTYHEAELRLNPANATIHFTDGSTAQLSIEQEGDDDNELEFEFSPPLTITSSGVSNAVIDFAPVVTLSGANYILGHDHDHDDTGELEDVEDAEVRGSFVRRSGDTITLDVNGRTVLVDISGGGIEFKNADANVTRDAFLAALSAGVEVKAEGTFSTGSLVAREAEIESDNDNDNDNGDGGGHGKG